jgi:hypothetical protein
MTMAKYSDLLRDPRWQKKRLEILQRDNFTCQHCKDTETELHVHHEEYHGKPWEVESNKLVTLCKHCHFIIENFTIDRTIGGSKLFSKKGIACVVVRNVTGYNCYAFYSDGSFWQILFVPDIIVNHLIENHHNQLTNG